jgi:hypothetical protein
MTKTATTADMRRRTVLEDVTDAIRFANRRGKTEAKDIRRLMGLKYLATNTTDYGVRLSIEDAELIATLKVQMDQEDGMDPDDEK